MSAGQTRAPHRTLANLNGMLFCGECAIPMMTLGEGTKGSPSRYVCPQAMFQGAGRCRTPEIPAERLDGAVFRHIGSVMTSNDLLPRLTAAVRGEAGAAAGRATEQLGKLQERQSAVAAERSNVLWQIENGRTSYQESRESLHSMSLSASELEKLADATGERLTNSAAIARAGQDEIREAASREGLHGQSSPLNRIKMLQAVLHRVVTGTEPGTARMDYAIAVEPAQAEIRF